MKKKLELLIDYETETVVNSKTEPDLTFLNDCYEALKKYENSDNIISEKNLKEIEQKARIRYQSKFTHYIPRKRLATIIIAAALLICLLCMTAYAYLNPFSQFVKNVKDLLGIESGAVINNGDGELSADKNAVVYESIEDLEKAFGLRRFL